MINLKSGAQRMARFGAGGSLAVFVLTCSICNAEAASDPSFPSERLEEIVEQVNTRFATGIVEPRRDSKPLRLILVSNEGGYLSRGGDGAKTRWRGSREAARVESNGLERDSTKISSRAVTSGPECDTYWPGCIATEGPRCPIATEQPECAVIEGSSREEPLVRDRIEGGFERYPLKTVTSGPECYTYWPGCFATEGPRCPSKVGADRTAVNR